MKLILSLGIIIGLLAFIFRYSSFDYQSPDYEKIADKITVTTAKELKMQKEEA